MKKKALIVTGIILIVYIICNSRLHPIGKC